VHFFTVAFLKNRFILTPTPFPSLFTFFFFREKIPKDNQRQKKMIPFKYPNLTIIDESEVEQIASTILGRVIVARIPESARQSICHDNIRDALQEEFEIDIEIEKISRFGPDYLILADSPTIATQILNKGSLAINSFTVALLPWTTEYGSITVPLHTQLPNIQIPQAQEQIAPCNQHVAIEISGLPPHLCYQSTLHQLFSTICAVTHIKFIRADLTYSVVANTPPANIPDIAHIAIKKSTQAGDILNIWTLWYQVTTAEMYPFIEPSSLLTDDQDIEGNFTSDTKLSLLTKLL
jgi:hypothetical protein